MVSVTRQTSLFAATLLLLTIGATVARLHYNPFAAETAVSPFMPQLWQQIASGILLFVTAILTNRITVKTGILRGFSTLPVTLFGFIACGILLSPNLLTASLLALLTSIAMLFLLQTLHSIRDKEALFTGALFLGMLPIICPPSIFFATTILIIIFVVPLSFRQTIIATTGYLLPIAVASYIHWYLGGNITDIALNVWSEIITPATKIALEPLPIVTALLFIALILTLIYGVMIGTHNRYAMLVPARKAIQLNIWMLLFGIVALFAIPGCNITIIPSIAISITIISAFAIDRMETKWANWFYLTIVALVIIHLLLY